MNYVFRPENVYMTEELLLTTLKVNWMKFYLRRTLSLKPRLILGSVLTCKKNSETVVTIYDNQSCFELYNFAVDLDLAEKYFWLRFWQWVLQRQLKYCLSSLFCAACTILKVYPGGQPAPSLQYLHKNNGASFWAKFYENFEKKSFALLFLQGWHVLFIMSTTKLNETTAETKQSHLSVMCLQM